MAEILTQAQRCDTRLPGRELSRHGIDNMKGNRETLWIKIQLVPLSLSRLDRICGGMAAMGPGYGFADCGICDSGGGSGDSGGNGHGSHVSRSRGHDDAHVGTSGHSGRDAEGVGHVLRFVGSDADVVDVGGWWRTVIWCWC